MALSVANGAAVRVNTPWVCIADDYRRFMCLWQTARSFGLSHHLDYCEESSAAGWHCQSRVVLPSGRIHCCRCGQSATIVVICTFGRRSCRLTLCTTIVKCFSTAVAYANTSMMFWYFVRLSWYVYNLRMGCIHTARVALTLQNFRARL